MQNYEVSKCIGKGSFGSVYLAKSRADGQSYVVKKIALQDMPPEDRESALGEVRLLAQLKHPNIVAYKESFMYRHGDDQSLCIVMQYCDAGDLNDKISHMKDQGKQFSEEQVLDWLVQLLLALEYIHERKILHRDLKTKNIFLTKGGKVIKLGDFGIARVLGGTMDMAMTVVGTPYYMSPELCMNKPYSYKSDVWALGCIIYELCSLKHAFDANNISGLVYKIMQGSTPPISAPYSQPLKDLVKKMLSRSPDNRPSVSSILQLPFVKSRMSAMLLDYTSAATAQAMSAVGKASAGLAEKQRRREPPDRATVPDTPSQESEAPPDIPRGRAHKRLDEARQQASTDVIPTPPRISPPAAITSTPPRRIPENEESFSAKKALAEAKERQIKQRQEELRAASEESLHHRNIAKERVRQEFHQHSVRIGASSAPPQSRPSPPHPSLQPPSSNALHPPNIRTDRSVSPSPQRSSSASEPKSPSPSARVNSNNISNNNNNNPSPIPRTHSAPPTHEPQRQQQERSLVPPRRLHSADEPIGTRAGKSALSGIGEDSEDVFDVILAPKEERWNENHHKNNNDRKSTSPHRNNHHRQGKEAEEQVYQDDFEDFEYEDDWETLTEEEEEELCDMVGMLQRQLEAPPRPPSGAVGLATPVPSKSSSHPPSTPLLEPNAKEIYSRKAIALQEKCERELGKSLFQRVYDYIWDKRVQKRTPRGNHMSAEDMDRAFEEEEREIYEGVVKLAAGDNKKLSSCFLVDQLIFWQRTAQGW
eukprot:CAMPEP_0184672754 /NCGR_PEP_ID=MMETSP0308-20130426/86289_1 /TAXON_ID=38269 /ORGANISM="Gloeochaete witrockiana, Strain SAG 46.84" /LENGTH=761 /DNA_ID=CAMNT_0027120141 /DNA_START=221 /DNA_END=2503 /DNA_ORIENTATION=+